MPVNSLGPDRQAFVTTRDVAFGAAFQQANATAETGLSLTARCGEIWGLQNIKVQIFGLTWTQVRGRSHVVTTYACPRSLLVVHVSCCEYRRGGVSKI